MITFSLITPILVMLEAFFSQKSPSSDIYALGVLALEIAAWTQAVETQASSEEERIQLMLDSLVDQQQRSFIEACFDPNPATRPRIKALLNNPAVSEVPTLRLLSAKILVNSTKSVPSEDTAAPVTAGSGATVAVAEVKQETPAGFAGLLQDYMSHLEDETVIVEVTFPTDQISKTRTWKDFRSNFTFTSKYLEDVK
uniref:Protein kinase domain-containing protein n=1 Tax=Mesocestoides corti TaxID=53468 RepID=A0A5K3FQ80_MESCO